MFTQRLSKKDLQEFAEKIVCGASDQIISDIEVHKLYDQEGSYKSLYIEFLAQNSKDNQETTLNAEIVDFNPHETEHNLFMVDKFDAEYVASFKSFLKSISDMPNVTLYYDEYKKCKAQYNKNHNKNTKDPRQTTLETYMYSQERQ